MTAKEFLAKYVSPQMIRDFKRIGNDERKEVMKALGGYCSQCGGDDEWCCYDSGGWDD